MSARPRIVADDAIPWAREALGALGELTLRPGRAIDHASLREADALVVRTITRVDAALVAGTPVRFVGTATAGVDHLDVAGLTAAGITVASAAGCNATAVAQYVSCALHLLALERDRELLRGPIAVIGLGQVGRRVVHRLRALGVEVRVSDPPLAAARARAPLAGDDPLTRLAREEPLLSLAEATTGARAVTLHVPLVADGDHPTVGLVGDEVLGRLPQGACVLNTSRGGVIDEQALLRWLDASRGQAVLDVWSGEPAIDLALADHDAVRLATPHVAGYTVEGKVAGTSMIADALAQHLGTRSLWRGDEVLGAPQPIDAPDGPTALARRTAVLRACNPIERADASLRATFGMPLRQRVAAFEGLRRDYELRRELAHFVPPREAAELLCVLGLATPPPPAIVLVAHGSPDPDWRLPLDRTVAQLRERAPGLLVRLAFLDHLTPRVAEAIAGLHAEGHRHMRVIAAFLSPGGGHVKRDVPNLIATARAAHPDTVIELVPGAIGAEPELVDALVRATVRLAHDVDARPAG